MNNQFHLPLL